MFTKEASARIESNKLLKESGWRFDVAQGKATLPLSLTSRSSLRNLMRYVWGGHE